LLSLRQLAGRAGRAYRSAVVRRTSGRRDPGDPAEVAAAVEASATDLERLLVDNVVPFWPRVVDDAGGFHLRHDITGRPLEAPTKFLVGQARLTWWFARLARSRWGTAEDTERARHGFRFLADRLWDDGHGGFFWAVPAAGGAPDFAGKEALAQAYGLLALAELAAAGHAEAAALAAELWRVFDAGCHDDEHGGWVELRGRDWFPVDRGGPFTTDPEAKTLGVQLHVLEALNPWVAAGGEAAAGRLLELLLVLTVTMGRTPERPGHGRFRRDWRPAPGYVMRQYGHDVQLQWMVEEAWGVLGLPPAGLEPLLRDTLDDVLRFGYDHRRGGVYWTGYAGRTAHKTEKEYWSQAEGLLAALRLHRRTGDPRYGRCYLGTLDWIVRHQADWEHGDWHHWVDARGRGSGDKSGEWKDPYHQGRALLECLETLRPT
jgi:mannose/cellobiose epimerase-like protein (N-acyl-D-glucosamine 2-epimerase family)